MRLLDLLHIQQIRGKLADMASLLIREQREALVAEAAELDLACMDPQPADPDPLRSRWTQETLDFEAEVLERVRRRKTQ